MNTRQHDVGCKRSLKVDMFTRPYATFGGENNEYRYVLERDWGGVLGTVMFLMRNPSVADTDVNDATVAKCQRYAQGWSFDRLLVGNTFAYRATDQKRLVVVTDPVGPDNDQHLVDGAAVRPHCVCLRHAARLPTVSRARGGATVGEGWPWRQNSCPEALRGRNSESSALSKWSLRYGNLGGGTRVQILSALKLFDANATRLNPTTRSAARNKKALDLFVGSPGGGKDPMGVYQRTSVGGIKPLLVFVSNAKYKSRLPVRQIAMVVYETDFGAIFDKSLRDALVLEPFTGGK